MHKVTIRWGMPSSEQEPVTYTFTTEAELNAFLYGIDEMDGWLAYEIIEDDT